MTIDRYHRQILLPEIGLEGQQRLTKSTALIVGCGALGCGVADLLARAGVGRLRLVDRDVVETTNLQRQVLFDQDDAESSRPKAIAAARRLARINSDITIEPIVDDFRPECGPSLVEGVDVLIDGLDNLEARYLLNDLSVERGLPYIYAGAVGTGGLVAALLPCGSAQAGSVKWSESQAGPCLRCLFPEPPPAGTLPTCDTAGVLGPAVAAITAHQAALVMRLLVGAIDGRDRSLHSIDPWHGDSRRLAAESPRSGCPCCEDRIFEWLDGTRGCDTEVLCGRGTVQVRPASSGALDLGTLAERMAEHGEVVWDADVLRLDLHGGTRMTVFPDGRALLGVDDISAARTLYDRLIGS